ncbi:MAG: sulfatase-like hydrolase/transferase [Bacteroidia bacterium]
MKPHFRTSFVLFCLAAALQACSLTSEKWDIHPDQDRIAFHERFLAEPAAAAPKDRPNVVIIMADDLGKTDISQYGGTHVRTPHIDAIGQAGVTFKEGYITSPICSPSRAGMLTGRYQQRFGYEYQPHDRYPKNGLEYFVYRNFLDSPTWQLTSDREFPSLEAIVQQGLPMEEFTLAELLKKHGYATGIIGKWHLGVEEHAWPNKRGFDHQYGFYEAYSLYQPDTASPDILNQHHDDFSDPYIWKGGRKGNCALRCNHTVVEDSVYLTQRLALEASEFIDRHREEPFFLYVPFSAPHTPFQITREYYDRFPNETDRNKRIYYGMIAALDDAVGQIMATIYRNGLDFNTVVWFLSDNGGATYTRATDNYPLKGGKFTNFEGGLNVPFMLRWTGKIGPLQQYKHPIISMDIFQTVAEIAGVDLPNDRPYDGVNLLPYVKCLLPPNPALQFPRYSDDPILENPNYASQIPDSIAPHKALFWRSNYAWAVRMGPWKLIGDEKSHHYALYNLQADKSEQHNLYTQSPDIVRMLEAAYNEWEKGTLPPKWQRVMDYRYPTADGDFWFPL